MTIVTPERDTVAAAECLALLQTQQLRFCVLASELFAFRSLSIADLGQCLSALSPGHSNAQVWLRRTDLGRLQDILPAWQSECECRYIRWRMRQEEQLCGGWRVQPLTRIWRFLRDVRRWSYSVEYWDLGARRQTEGWVTDPSVVSMGIIIKVRVLRASAQEKEEKNREVQGKQMTK